MQGQNQSVGNQDAGRLDAALELEHRDGKSDAQRLSLVQGLPFSRSKWLSEDWQRGGASGLQSKGTNVGTRLLQRRRVGAGLEKK